MCLDLKPDSHKQVTRGFYDLGYVSKCVQLEALLLILYTLYGTTHIGLSVARERCGCINGLSSSRRSREYGGW